MGFAEKRLHIKTGISLQAWSAFCKHDQLKGCLRREGWQGQGQGGGFGVVLGRAVASTVQKVVVKWRSASECIGRVVSVVVKQHRFHRNSLVGAGL